MSRVQTVTLGANANPAIQALGQLQAALQPLNKATNQFASALSAFNRQASATNTAVTNLSSSFDDMNKRLTALEFSVLSRGVSKLTNDIKTAFNTSLDFSKQIALIQTITQEAGLSTDEWASRLTKLSNEFGVPQVETAKAAYEALQNQVADAATVTDFLTDAFKLARVTGSDVNSSVNVLSSTLNAFGLTAKDAERVSGQLFEAVDRGRFRIQDLESQFGRTSVTARQLGVTLPELSAALATLTRQGISLDTAQTQVLNIFNKLLQSGPELTKTLNELGFASGRELINQQGLVGVFRVFNDVVEKSPERLADILPEIRALQGALGLTGKSLNDFVKDLEAVDQSGTKFRNSVQLTADALGNQFQVQVQRLKNFDQELFGFRAVEAVVGFLNKVLDLIAAARQLNDIFKASAQTFRDFFGLFDPLIDKIQEFRSSVGGLGFDLSKLADSPAAGLLFGGFFRNFQVQRAITSSEEFGKALQAQSDQRVKDQQKNNVEVEKFFEASLKRQVQSFVQFAGSVRSESLILKNRLNADLKDVNDRIELLSKGVGDSIRNRISQLQQFAENAKKIVEDSLERSRELSRDLEVRRFNIQLEQATPERQFDILIRKVDELVSRSQGLSELGNTLTEVFGVNAEQEIKGSVEAFDDAIRVLDRAIDKRRELGDVQSRVRTQQRLVAGAGGGLEEVTGLARTPQFQNINELLRASKSLQDLQLASKIITEERLKAEQELVKVQNNAAETARRRGEEEKLRLREFLELTKQVAEFSLFDKTGKLKFPSVDAGLNELKNLQLQVIEKAGGDLSKAFTGLELGKRFSEQLEKVQSIESLDRLSANIETKRKELDTVLANLVKTVADNNTKLTTAQATVNKGLSSLATTFQTQANLARTQAGRDELIRRGARPEVFAQSAEALSKFLIGLQRPGATVEDFRSVQGGLNQFLDQLGIVFQQDFSLGKQQFEELVQIKIGMQKAVQEQQALRQVLAPIVSGQAAAVAQSAGALLGGGIPGVAAAAANLAVAQQSAQTVITQIAENTALQNTLLQRQAQVAQGLQSTLITTISELQGVNAQLNLAKNIVSQIGGSLPVFQHGGLVTGAKGNDKILARLTHGEFVMPPAQTKKFYTELMAMRAGNRPPGFAAGGLVTNNNIGDINVIVRGGDTREKSLRNVAQGLRRGIRRGIIKLN